MVGLSNAVRSGGGVGWGESGRNGGIFRVTLGLRYAHI